tara:strand:- start:185 stop:433 length:249 start_codon:yes stop_codon:yes gene_type:complete
MDYAIRILLEEKVNIEEELKIIDKQERREPQERRLISIVNALNKLNIDDVSVSLIDEVYDKWHKTTEPYEFTRWLNKKRNER